MIFDSLTFTANQLPLIFGNITKIKFGWNFDQAARKFANNCLLFLHSTTY